MYNDNNYAKYCDILIFNSTQYIPAFLLFQKRAAMDLQNLADTFFSPTCIVSVELTPDGGYGAIRLAACNAKYVEMIDMRIEDAIRANTPGAPAAFVPGSLYTDYFPHNRSFEDICFRAAVQKTPFHTYAHLDSVDIWFDIYAMPLDLQDGGLSYCVYTATPRKNANIVLDTVQTA